ncbi:unnamed protein product [Pseudo-nitzschia multistriata]|uniref:Uncharacterized protein n=1 Tax=Pseudo-nitzschia multistriata TaxID=183589 RepID=A0A448Z372_9STRA|nr:unnamed protein product [Pseudo-nitzschia multistriata]
MRLKYHRKGKKLLHGRAVSLICFGMQLVLLVVALFSNATALRANSWQKRFDRAFLQVDGVTPEGRFRSFQRALKDPRLRSDVSKAIDIIQEKGFGKGHPEFIEILWPKGTQARRDLEAINALTKQIPERINEFENDSPESRSSNLNRLFQSIQDGVSAEVAASSFLKRSRSDPEGAVRLAENVFRNAPIGLESPSYEVLGKFSKEEGDTTTPGNKNNDSDHDDAEASANKKESFTTCAPMELRRYDAFRSISTPILDTGSSSYMLESMGSALVRLSSYLELGNNVDQIVMSMTVPFFISDSPTKGVDKMFMKLPLKNESDPPETVESSGITLDDFPETVFATLSFPGICTDQEIKRQKAKLLERIKEAGDIGWKVGRQMGSDDKIELGEGESNDEGQEFFVLQYNPPGTLPWRRTNEIAIVMEKASQTHDDKEVKDDVDLEPKIPENADTLKNINIDE